MTNELIQQSRDLILQLTNELELTKPKADAYDNFLDSDAGMSGQQVAAMLAVRYTKEDKKAIGKNTLYSIFRQLGIFKPNTRQASQYCVDNKYATVISKLCAHGSYEYVTIWNPKGFDYIYRMLIKKGYYVERNTKG